ncbi:MAG: Fe-S protein, partial [Candidatus Eiseniibacteriota bacterium]
MKLFTNRQRPVHLGPFPLERLKRAPLPSEAAAGPRPARPAPRSAPAAGSFDGVAWQYLKLFEQFRDGKIAPQKAPIALDPVEITNDLKAGAYFIDASMVGACTLPEYAWYATGEDGKPLAPYHRYALVVLVESGRAIETDNPASSWVAGADSNRDAMRATEIACVLAGYIRNLGWSARAHTRDVS